MISLNIFLKLTPIVYISLPLLSSKTIQLSRDIQKGVGGKEKRIDKSQTERKNEWVSRKEGEKERKRERGNGANSARVVASAASSSDVGQPRGDRERPRGSPRIGENGRAAITLRASGSPAYWRMRSSLPRSFTVDQVTNLPTPGRQLASRIDRWKNVDFSRMRNPSELFVGSPEAQGKPRNTVSVVSRLRNVLFEKVLTHLTAAVQATR